MTARIDGKAIARGIRAAVAEEIASAFGDPGSAPGLATILVIDVGIHRTPVGLTGDVRMSEVDGIAGRSPPSREVSGP